MSEQDQRLAATVRVNAALDKDEAPADADLLVCDIAELRRAQQREMRRDPVTAAWVRQPRRTASVEDDT